MASPLSSAPSSIAVTIANPDQWSHGHDTEMPIGCKRCHLRPSLQYTTTGLIDNAMYNVQLKIEQLEKLKLKFMPDKNRYWKQAHDHETMTCQFVDFPGIPENSWVKGIDLKFLDFSKVFFTKQHAPGEVVVRPLIRYMPSVVIKDTNGNSFEFVQPTQMIIPISGKRKIQYNLPPVPIEGEEETEEEFEEPAPKRKAPAREFDFGMQEVRLSYAPSIAQPLQLTELPTAPLKPRRQLMNPSHPHFPYMDLMSYRGYTEEETIDMYERPTVIDAIPAPQEIPGASDDIFEEIIDNENDMSKKIEGFDKLLHSDDFFDFMDKLDQQQEDFLFISSQ
ncbi:hypothetical protein CAEBREN_15550 [Caenorhabditis brenneri]|uniref:T-box domain-containing protein n=1 Tax=Caenorhabditis brenneri TaxID=135651 RepID=G0MMX4_CAEBE|nr:hypothetical protein CAEBREN_15550 [Caenorhabditis brenneri]